MKINIEVDLTPDEARRMLGLPDLAPMFGTTDGKTPPGKPHIPP